MKAIEAAEFIGQIIKKSVEDIKYTGSLDIHADCLSGGICNVKIALTEKKVTLFEFSSGDKKSVDSKFNLQ